MNKLIWRSLKKLSLRLKTISGSNRSIQIYENDFWYNRFYSHVSRLKSSRKQRKFEKLRKGSLSQRLRALCNICHVVLSQLQNRKELIMWEGTAWGFPYWILSNHRFCVAFLRCAFSLLDLLEIATSVIDNLLQLEWFWTRKLSQ